MIYTVSFTDKMLNFKLKIYGKLCKIAYLRQMNLINLRLLLSAVTTNPAETLWQLQNDEIFTLWIWSGFVTEFIGFVIEQKIWNTTNNNNKNQRWNLDSGAFRPGVMKPFMRKSCINYKFFKLEWRIIL